MVRNTVFRQGNPQNDENIEKCVPMNSHLRIAWIGTPGRGGGVGGFCRQLLSGLIQTEECITAFTQLPVAAFLEATESNKSEVTVVSREVPWEWGRWYSIHPTVSFVSSFWKRRKAYRQLIADLVKSNQKEPFDVIVQFSQIELFDLQKHLPSLPPVVLFPCVHAAGELRWHRRESAYALQSESRIRHYLIRSNLMHRSRLQRSCCQAVHGVIGMSERFNQLVAQDYGVDTINQAVIYQPIDRHDSMQTSVDTRQSKSGKIKLLFVGRVSVRKGIEMLVELSHRLDDLQDIVEIEVIGGGSLWSDYTKHLNDLNPRVARFSGSLDNAEVKARMSQSHGLLVPSHYEPGGIVVAEALSHGCAVIVSDEVGSAEPLSGEACYKFPAGNMEILETTVREFVNAAKASPESIRTCALELANRCYSPDVTIERLRGVLTLAAQRKPISEIGSPQSKTSIDAVS